MRTRVFVLAACWSIAACLYQPAAVRLQGSHVDLAALGGRWVGEYTGEQSGRNGTILFRLIAAQDSAYGDVLMIAGGKLPQGATAPESTLPRGTSQLLRIAFVRVNGRHVSGAMEPYMDPACECTVHTTFFGTLRGDQIEGTYVTRFPGGREQSGSWHVQRRERS